MVVLHRDRAARGESERRGCGQGDDQFYLRKSDCGIADIPSPPKNPDEEEGSVFAAYWAARRDRFSCAAWFADRLFGPEFSDRLLARGSRQKGDLSPWWAIAAARLNPRDASRILREALGNFSGEYDSDKRSALCAALWQLCGRSETGFILDWFYDGTPQGGALPGGRDPFIRAMDLHTADRGIIAELIRDPRFSSLDWHSLETLARRVNDWSQTPVITEDELRKARHPLGYYGPDRQAEAERIYPGETAELLGHLETWRQRLRVIAPDLLEGIKSAID